MLKGFVAPKIVEPAGILDAINRSCCQALDQVVPGVRSKATGTKLGVIETKTAPITNALLCARIWVVLLPGTRSRRVGTARAMIPAIRSLGQSDQWAGNYQP